MCSRSLLSALVILSFIFHFNSVTSAISDLIEEAAFASVEDPSQDLARLMKDVKVVIAEEPIIDKETGKMLSFVLRKNEKTGELEFHIDLVMSSLKDGKVGTLPLKKTDLGTMFPGGPLPTQKEAKQEEAARNVNGDDKEPNFCNRIRIGEYPSANVLSEIYGTEAKLYVNKMICEDGKMVGVEVKGVADPRTGHGLDGEAFFQFKKALYFGEGNSRLQLRFENPDTGEHLSMDNSGLTSYSADEPGRDGAYRAYTYHGGLIHCELRPLNILKEKDVIDEGIYVGIQSPSATLEIKRVMAKDQSGLSGISVKGIPDEIGSGFSGEKLFRFALGPEKDAEHRVFDFTLSLGPQDPETPENWKEAPQYPERISIDIDSRILYYSPENASNLIGTVSYRLDRPYDKEQAEQRPRRIPIKVYSEHRWIKDGTYRGRVARGLTITKGSLRIQKVFSGNGISGIQVSGIADGKKIDGLFAYKGAGTELSSSFEREGGDKLTFLNNPRGVTLFLNSGAATFDY